MAVTGKFPYIPVIDTNGRPVVGAKLHVYDAGTTNYRAIYSDDGLSTSLPNPLTVPDHASNARGYFPKFYMAAGTYKLRLETSAGGLIWEEDDLDTGLSAGAGALPISAGGTSATTASAARAALDVPSNSELADLAADLAGVIASVQSIIGTPQGRLTLTSGTPVISSGVSAGTAIYYTPYLGAQLPIFSGSVFAVKQFSELTLTLHSNHVANAIYDVFIWEENGVVTIGTGPAWNTATAGAGARGTGAGTTELERLSGIWVNANSMTTRNGATTYTVAENRGTYVGSIYMDGTNGQVTCHTAFGQSRKWGVWNAYNRKPISLDVGDSTSTWTYGTSTFRPSRNQTANSLTVFSGLSEEAFTVDFRQNLAHDSTNTASARVGIGWDSTSAASGYNGRARTSQTGVFTTFANVSAHYIHAPILGISVVTALESCVEGTGVTFAGTSSDMLLNAMWDG